MIKWEPGSWWHLPGLGLVRGYETLRPLSLADDSTTRVEIFPLPNQSPSHLCPSRWPCLAAREAFVYPPSISAKASNIYVYSTQNVNH